MVSRVVIETPTIRPYRFGLSSVADVSTVSDVHVLGGFSYEQQCGHSTGYGSDPCTGLSASAGGGDGPYPAALDIDSDIPGDYIVDWGDGTALQTVVVTTGGASPTHNYAAVGAKTIIVVGPLGYGTRTVTITAGGAANSNIAAKVQKTALDGLTTVYGDRLAVYAKHVCRMVGISRADAQARATSALNASESYAMEQAVMSRYLANATDVGGAATTPERALALLENYAATVYVGEPIIHVDRFTGSLLGTKGAIGRHGTRLETEQGVPVAAGAGYSEHPLVATTTMYVTGNVIVRKGVSEVRGAPTMPSPDNEETWLAERPMAIAVECIAAKALVSTT